MKCDLFLLPQAEVDLDSHCLYLAENADVETALRFYDAAFSSFERLCGTPLVGVRREYFNPTLSGLRMWFVKDFENYLIFYQILDDVIQIVRVLHSSQDSEKIVSESKPM